MIEIKEIQIDTKDLDKGSIVADYDKSCVVDWKGFDNQADMQYIKKCAESVGMDVTDRTAFTIPFIAKVMRRMNKFNRSKEAYNKGYDDGQDALAYHLELCKDEGSIIEIPEGATNGDMIKALFPNAQIEYHNTFVRVIIKTIGDNYVPFNYDVWNSPYRKEQK